MRRRTSRGRTPRILGSAASAARTRVLARCQYDLLQHSNEVPVLEPGTRPDESACVLLVDIQS